MTTLLAFILTLAHAEPFTEAEFKQALAESKTRNERVIFYTWSPHMYLSLTGLDDLRRDAGGARVIPILDPNASQKVAKKIQAEHGWPADVLRTLASETLLKRGLLTHYPSYTLAKDGHLVGPTIAGYKHPEGLRSIVKAVFQ